MKKNYHLLSFTFLLIAVATTVFAQEEKLLPLQSNMQLKQFWHSARSNNAHIANKSQAVNDTLKIPVIDDFSYDDLFPASNIWADSNVFVNSTFPMHPPSVGVATFDGMDKYGNPYNNVTQGASGLCDSLTSKPINLYDDGQGNLYQLSDSIWLSFYMERKGYGNSVEPGDSIVLQFYDTATLSWEEMWSLSGGTQDTLFTRYTVKITDAKWFYNGFRFRFVNYGSQSGNLDHWHLDYVILRKVFSPYDNNIDDVAWSYRSASLLNNYTSVPWNHYKALSATDKAALMHTTQTLYYSNINQNPANIRLVSNIDGIYDQSGNQLQLTPGTNTNNIFPQRDTTYVYSLNSFVFPDNLPPVGDAYEFNIVNRLSTTPDNNRNNDTIRYKQVFRSYYAYDDGTAEAGYSLYPSPTGKFAMRFNLLQTDTIRGVRLCFTPVSPNMSSNLFRLTIWSALAGVAGAPSDVVIYQQSNLHPALVDEVNGFAYYAISDTDLILSGQVYIGIVQQTSNYYGFGFDSNTDNNSRMYYNTNFGWTQSTIPGTWMIRPVFGDSTLITSSQEISMGQDDINVFPNPAYDFITITSQNFNPGEKISVKLYNLQGKEFLNQEVILQGDDKLNMPIEKLSNGIYMLRIESDSGVAVKKIVKL